MQLCGKKNMLYLYIISCIDNSMFNNVFKNITDQYVGQRSKNLFFFLFVIKFMKAYKFIRFIVLLLISDYSATSHYNTRT